MLGVRCFERDQDLRDLVDGMLLATAVSSFGRVQGLVVDHGGLAEAPEGQVALAPGGIPTTAMAGYDGVEADGVGWTG